MTDDFYIDYYTELVHEYTFQNNTLFHFFNTVVKNRIPIITFFFLLFCFVKMTFGLVI